MDKDSAVKAKKRALVKRAAAFDHIKSILDLGVMSNSDLDSRERFFFAVNDLSDFKAKFVNENEALLDALIDLGEEQDFSSSMEVEVNNMVISAKVLAKRLFDSSGVFNETLSVYEDETHSERSNGSDYSISTNVIPSMVVPTVSSSNLARLPKTSLPRFEGDFMSWPIFCERFIALVDRQLSISNIEKFHYLLDCLGSEAAKVVKDIAVSNETYPEAWATLIEHYNQPRQIVADVLTSMLCKSVPNISQESIRSLKKFLDTYDEKMIVLKSLDIPDLGDFLMFSIAFQIFPDSCLHLFKIKNLRTYPSVQDLFTFVRNRVRDLKWEGKRAPFTKDMSITFGVLRFMEESFSDEKPARATVTVKPVHDSESQAPDMICPICHGTHFLSECSIFIDSDIESRFDIVSNNRLCISCFSNKHWADSCKKRCPKCQRPHNLLLHHL